MVASFGCIMTWTNWNQEADAIASIGRVYPEYGSSLGGTQVQVQGQGFNAIMTDVALGGEFSCGISDGKVFCWGRNDYGQLGDGTTTNRLVPTPVDTSGVLNGLMAKAITAGLYHTCVIASDDNAYCWGWNDRGQLGNKTTTDSLVPVKVTNEDTYTSTAVLNGLNVTAISASNNSTCVIASDDNVYCWGAGDMGQLGDGNASDNSEPVGVIIPSPPVSLSADAISGGGDHFCAISGGAAVCWGQNDNGQLGNGGFGASNEAVLVDDGGVLNGLTITAIAAGGNHTCAIASDQKAYCWGYGYYGQLGNNSIAS
ncbi:MAG: hypothetical protein LBK50_03310, partial [Candidatus Nomurabacteria bacterium]|nr:hypothetical protein [Candidatus Nomurabacteria bacterium]